jgi:hypothetical protein
MKAWESNYGGIVLPRGQVHPPGRTGSRGTQGATPGAGSGAGGAEGRQKVVPTALGAPLQVFVRFTP